MTNISDLNNRVRREMRERIKPGQRPAHRTVILSTTQRYVQLRTFIAKWLTDEFQEVTVEGEVAKRVTDYLFCFNPQFFTLPEGEASALYLRKLQSFWWELRDEQFVEISERKDGVFVRKGSAGQQ